MTGTVGMILIQRISDHINPVAQINFTLIIFNKIRGLFIVAVIRIIAGIFFILIDINTAHPDMPVGNPCIRPLCAPPLLLIPEDQIR